MRQVEPQFCPDCQSEMTWHSCQVCSGSGQSNIWDSDIQTGPLECPECRGLGGDWVCEEREEKEEKK